MPIIDFIEFILKSLLGLMLFALVLTAVLSWLSAFNIINTRSPAVYRLMDMLDRVTAPILEPFRRLIPPIGGFDISFILAWVVIEGMLNILIDPAFDNLRRLIAS